MSASTTSGIDCRRFLVSASAAALELALCTPAAAATPKRLAVYYGYPSLVEGAKGDLGRAAEIFGRYEIIVFGDGLELGDGSTDSGLRVEHRRLSELVPRLHAMARRPMVHGYIDLGRTQQLTDGEIARRIDAWRRLGADGIFYDEAGIDFGVTRARRAAAVAAVHDCGMSVFMNAFNPDDLFETSGLGARDALLLESFAVREGIVQPREHVVRRMAAAAKWRRQTGIRICAVTTTTLEHGFDSSAFQYAVGLASELGVDAFGWGEPNFSADTTLPLRWPEERANYAIANSRAGARSSASEDGATSRE